LLLLLVYLVTRNVVKLIFERKQNIFGHRLRTKLVITFFTLSLFPTIILFGLASQFISTSMEYWYNIQVEQSLKTSLELGKSFYQKAINSGFTVSNQLGETVSKRNLLDKIKRQQLLKLIRDARREHRLHNIAIYSNNLKLLARDPQTESPPIVLDQPMRDVIQQVATNGQSLHHITPSAAGDLIWTLT
ncbi:MAG: hypothetical protein GWN93_17070, partial [Deltaproteobacteria bacterium]|nr:hypothetical protein [Deltaproteobacteria bacterium]